MSSSQSQSGTQGQGVGSPISNDAYNVITALQSKLEGWKPIASTNRAGAAASSGSSSTAWIRRRYNS